MGFLIKINIKESLEEYDAIGNSHFLHKWKMVTQKNFSLQRDCVEYATELLKYMILIFFFKKIHPLNVIFSSYMHMK